ncbi:MAG UNVERIFIED_CONTAM: hypothetical protein LVQ98_09605 [Rickettsiaceae bacterium]|jgi:hypothetical protein
MLKFHKAKLKPMAFVKLLPNLITLASLVVGMSYLLDSRLMVGGDFAVEYASVIADSSRCCGWQGGQNAKC